MWERLQKWRERKRNSFAKSQAGNENDGEGGAAHAASVNAGAAHAASVNDSAALAASVGSTENGSIAGSVAVSAVSAGNESVHEVKSQKMPSWNDRSPAPWDPAEWGYE